MQSDIGKVMRSYLECIPCFFKQIIQSGRLTSMSEEDIRKVVDKFARKLPEIPFSYSPPKVAKILYAMIREASNNPDPYKQIKWEHTELALTYLRELKKIISSAEDKFNAAIRVAGAGNIIDLGALTDFDLDAEIGQIMQKKIEKWNIEILREKLKNNSKLLIIGDNAGETVFDRVLIEFLTEEFSEIEITYSVRGSPVINDATREDAIHAGIDKLATIIDTGSDAPGVILDDVSISFLDNFNSTDIVLSKGQGNYESLSNARRDIFFLLRIKCPVVALNSDIPQGEMALIYKSKNDR